MKASLFLTAVVLLSTGSVLPLNAVAQSAPTPAAPLPEAERGKVDINTADIPTLESIPEIGTNFANAVVASRPFKSVDDLQRILKITPEKMNELRRKVTVSAMKPTVPAGPDRPHGSGSKPPAVNEGQAKDSKEVTERYDRTVPSRPSAEKPGAKK